MVPTPRRVSLRKLGRVLGLLSAAYAVLGSAYLLSPFGITMRGVLVVWPVYLVAVAGVGAAAAWTNRTPLVWGAAILLSIVAVLGLLSIGFVFAPAALLALGSAAALQAAGVPESTRRSILDDPPGMRETVVKTLIGVAGIVGGTAIVYFGAFARELFEPCAVETIGCQVANTHWGAVAATLAGIASIGIGAWLIWRQLSIARIVDAGRPT